MLFRWRLDVKVSIFVNSNSINSSLYIVKFLYTFFIWTYRIVFIVLSRSTYDWYSSCDGHKICLENTRDTPSPLRSPTLRRLSVCSFPHLSPFRLSRPLCLSLPPFCLFLASRVPVRRLAAAYISKRSLRWWRLAAASISKRSLRLWSLRWRWRSVCCHFLWMMSLPWACGSRKLLNMYKAGKICLTMTASSSKCWGLVPFPVLHKLRWG